VKYELEELLKQLIEPSVIIAEGYEAEVFVTTDGEILSGIVQEEDDEAVYVRDDPYRDDSLVLPKDEIEERVVSEVSTMPNGLLTTFTREDILELMAYLDSLRVEAEDGE